MKNYVVNTPNENHFFTEKFEAEKDFDDAIYAIKMKKIKLEIGYRTDDIFLDPTHVVLSFTPELIDKIQYLQAFVKYNDIQSIDVTKGFSVISLLNKKADSEFKIGIDKLVISEHQLMYCAFNEYSGASYIESVPFTLKQIIKSRIK